MFEKYLLKKRFFWIIVVLFVVIGIALGYYSIYIHKNSQEKAVVNETMAPQDWLWKVSIFPTSHFENSYNIIFGKNGKLYTQVGRREGDSIVNGALCLEDYRDDVKVLSSEVSNELEKLVNKIMCSDFNSEPLEEAVACIDDGWMMTVDKEGVLVYSCIDDDKNMSKLFNELTKCSAITIDINGGFGGLP